MLTVGSPAPAFTLPDQTSRSHSLRDYAGRWLLLYFYPKDKTSGCTAEACGLRDQWKEFEARGCAVLGVSKDSVDSHAAFAAELKLPFPILSDETGATTEAYGAWQEKSMNGKQYMGIVRISYLIDPEGKIVKAYPKVKPEEHATEVLEDLRFLQS
jgi:peroxiredoxin Q/BCP